jgi:hypothetical protein
MQEQQRHAGRDSDRAPGQVWCEGSSHAPDRLCDHDYRGQHEAVEDRLHPRTRVGRRKDRERIHEERGGQRETNPRGERTQPAGTMESYQKADLTARWTWKELTQRHQATVLLAA